MTSRLIAGGRQNGSGIAGRARMFARLLLLAPFCFSLLTFPSVGLAQEDAKYLVDTGDKLRVKVHEWPDITGEYKVSSDGSLALPIIGILPVSGMQPNDIAVAVADRLKQKAKLADLPVTTVEMIQFRPYFVLGHVMKPGEYEYRPRLNVLQAVSIAGGLFRFNDPGLQRLDRDAIQARGDGQILRRKIDQLTVTIARIDAELKDQDTIELPPEFAEGQDQPQIKEILTTERATLTSNRATLAQEIAAAADMRKLLENEISSLEKQMDAEIRQLATVNQEMEGVKSLADRGLTTSPRTYLLERTKAQIVGQKQSIETQIIRSRQIISQTDQRLKTFRSTVTERLNNEKAKLQTELRDAQEKLQISQKLILEAEVSAPAQFSKRYSDDDVRYSIIRATKNSTQELPASEATLLLPNDVLKIVREAPSNERASSQQVVAP